MSDLKRLKSIATAAAFLAIGLTAACSQSPPPSVVAPAKRTSGAGADNGPLRQYALGVPVGTGTADVDVRFDLPAAPMPGAPFDLDVVVVSKAASPTLRVEVTPGDGLVVVAPTAPVTVDKPQPGAIEHVPVKATSAAAGTRLVTIKVTLDIPTGAQTREYAFPVVVGAPAAAPAGG